MEKKDGFHYTYSAKEQEEIRRIREKYEAPAEKEDKMGQLRRLDASVTSKATAISLVVGIIGTLILGSGMSLILTDMGEIFGDLGALMLGICVGMVGIILICLAYPIYNRTLRKAREKVAPEIMRLTDELMK